MNKFSLLFFFGVVAAFLTIVFSLDQSWKEVYPQSIPSFMTTEELSQILDQEDIVYKIDEKGRINTRSKDLSKTELLFTGLKAFHEPSSTAVGDLIIQKHLKRKIDILLNQLVGQGHYISEIYISPGHNTLPISKDINANDLVAQFLNSPGIKRIYFRLIVDSGELTKKQIDQSFVEGRVLRQLRSLLHDLKGVRLKEDVSFVAFHGTGLGSIAKGSYIESPELSMISKIFVPAMVLTAIVITWLVVSLIRRSKKRKLKKQEEAPRLFQPDIESIPLDDESIDEEFYVQLDELPIEVVESFTGSSDIGNLLFFLHPKEGANFLLSLPFDQQVTSIGKCIGFHKLNAVEKEQLLANVALQLTISIEMTRLMSRDSIRHVAKILSFLHPASGKRILQELHQIDAASLIRLKNEFFILNSILPLGEEGLRFLAKKGGFIDLFLSVHDSDGTIKYKIMTFASDEEREKISVCVDDFKKVSPEKIQSAQIRLTKLIVDFERNQAKNKKNLQKLT